MSARHGGRLIVALLALLVLARLPAPAVAVVPLAGEPAWQLTALAGYSVEALAVAPGSPGTIYATSQDSRIFKTTDGGATWPQVYFELGGYYGLAIDPRSPATVYVGTYGPDLNVLKTTDGGASWQKLPDIPPLNYVYALAVDPVNTSTVYAGVPAGWGVYKSGDGGGTWARVLDRTHVTALAVDPASPATVYAAAHHYNGQGGGLYKSTTGGQSWERVVDDPAVNAVTLDPTSSGVIYIGTETGGKKSADGGASWTSLSAGVSVRALAVDPANPALVYAGTAAGVFRSTDAGTTWLPLNLGLGNLNVKALAVAGTTGTVYAGTGGGVFRLGASTTPPVTATSTATATATVTATQGTAPPPRAQYLPLVRASQPDPPTPTVTPTATAASPTPTIGPSETPTATATATAPPPPPPPPPPPLPALIERLDIGTRILDGNECRVADPLSGPITLPAGATTFAYQLTVKVPQTQRVSVSVAPSFGGGGISARGCNGYTVINGQLYQNKLGGEVRRLDGQPLPSGSYTLIIVLNGSTRAEVPFTVP